MTKLILCSTRATTMRRRRRPLRKKQLQHPGNPALQKQTQHSSKSRNKKNLIRMMTMTIQALSTSQTQMMMKLWRVPSQAASHGDPAQLKRSATLMPVATAIRAGNPSKPVTGPYLPVEFEFFFHISLHLHAAPSHPQRNIYENTPLSLYWGTEGGGDSPLFVRIAPFLGTRPGLSSSLGCEETRFVPWAPSQQLISLRPSNFVCACCQRVG